MTRCKAPLPSQLLRHTSAPHLETELDKENNRRDDLNVSSHALKNMLRGLDDRRAAPSRERTEWVQPRLLARNCRLVVTRAPRRAARL